MQEIKCPNCGAPAKNHKNCEFCGSLLVRFANKGIDVSNTSYLNNDAVLPGLIKQLEKNLELQQKEDGYIRTEIQIEDERWKGGTYQICSVISSDCLLNQNDEYFFPNAESPSLGVVFGFSIYNSEIESENPEYKDERIKKEKFEQLNSFSLFESNVSRCEDEDGDDFIEYEYAIDFGQDAEGAARLISEIANKVYGCPLNVPLIYETSSQEDERIEAAAIAKEEAKENIKSWIYVVLGALGLLLWLILKLIF